MIRLGIICPSEIAFRRFMPALMKQNVFSFAGIAVNSIRERFGENAEVDESNIEIINKGREKAKKFVELYGGNLYESYEDIVTSANIDAVYIPLPPALHYKWAKLALEHKKHVMVEKPATTKAAHTKELIDLAAKNQCALHENYMFVFHNQLREIEQLIVNGVIGDIRLRSVKFGFPQRAKEDFRYNKKLGGGALMDAGGYTIKYASLLLNSSARVMAAQSVYMDGCEVDICGAGMLVDDDRNVVQIAYGMDNSYKCELEVWGSEGTLTAGRVLTAPADYQPTALIKRGDQEWTEVLSSDDTFYKSIQYFEECIRNVDTRMESRRAMLRQAELMGEFQKQAEGGNFYE